MGSIAAALFNAKTLAVTAVLFVVCLAAGRLLAGKPLLPPKPNLNDSLPAASIVLLAGLSALWAGEPKAAIAVALGAAGWLVLFVYGCETLRQETRHNACHIGEGLWIGFLFGLGYLLVEVFSNEAIKIFIVNQLHVPRSWLQPEVNYTWRNGKLIGISEADLTRNLTPIPLLLWPSLVALRSTSPRQARHVWQGMLFAVTAVVVMFSGSETAKLALLASSLIFLIAQRHTAAVITMLKVGWVAACMLVTLVGPALYRAQLQQASWLPYSAQHRVVIWNHIAEESMKRPWLGIGAGMTAATLAQNAATENKGTRFTTNVRHAHNMFLQIWYELGLAGALLSAWLGVALLAAIARLDQRFQPAALAVFTSSFVAASTSFGLWQSWFMSMFGLALLCWLVAMKVDYGLPATETGA